MTNANTPRWRCIDCNVQAWRRGEDFYVIDRLWKSVVPENGIICIGCFETRLGRTLTKRDFKKWFWNNRWWGDQKRKINNPPSQRLIDRLKLKS